MTSVFIITDNTYEKDTISKQPSYESFDIAEEILFEKLIPHHINCEVSITVGAVKEKYYAIGRGLQGGYYQLVYDKYEKGPPNYSVLYPNLGKDYYIVTTYLIEEVVLPDSIASKLKLLNG